MRELRALGAVRVAVGDIRADFGAPPVPVREAEGESAKAEDDASDAFWSAG